MNELSSLQVTDQESAAVAKNPAGRISLAEIEAEIVAEEVIHPEFASHMTLVILRLANGWLSVGVSTPADPANFDADLGIKFAKEDAIRKLWPVFAFAKLDHKAREAAEIGF